MQLDLVCTGKPSDGLLFYSYEHTEMLRAQGVASTLRIVPNPKFTTKDYLSSLTEKYVAVSGVSFDAVGVSSSVLLMGRSMLTLPFLDYRYYSQENQALLHCLFSRRLIVVYSNNHPEKYYEAKQFFKPSSTDNLCDLEVYPKGVGSHFEKRIFFDNYRHTPEVYSFKYLFLGTTPDYYAAAEALAPSFLDSCVLTYSGSPFLSDKLKHVFAPVPNLMSKFRTYVYTKRTFDPAPRLVQECKYYGRDICYARDKSLRDGGFVYYLRPIARPDIKPILNLV